MVGREKKVTPLVNMAMFDIYVKFQGVIFQLLWEERKLANTLTLHGNT